jgi:hypothetical protein
MRESTTLLLLNGENYKNSVKVGYKGIMVDTKFHEKKSSNLKVGMGNITHIVIMVILQI